MPEVLQGSLARETARRLRAPFVVLAIALGIRAVGRRWTRRGARIAVDERTRGSIHQRIVPRGSDEQAILRGFQQVEETG